MNRSISLMALPAMLAASVFCMTVRAAEGDTPPVKQQNKMVTCNKDAVGKKGDERRAFMSQCLSGGAAKKQASADPASGAAVDHAKACKAEAKGMRGNARKDAVAQCLAKAA